MFNIKPDNLVGDTNKLLFLILTELKKLNEVQSLRPIAKDVVVEPAVKSKKPKKEVTKHVSTGQKRKLPKV